MESKQLVLPFGQLSLSDLPSVGGKNASLGEMIRHLSKAGVEVPGGFATTAFAYKRFLKINGIDEQIYSTLDALDINDVKALKKAGAKIRRWIVNAKFSPEFEQAIVDAYLGMGGKGKCSIAVRSSATSEDLPQASFAGQQETYLNVSGRQNVLDAVKRVFASLFTDRAIVYRTHHGFKHRRIAISAGIQWMVRSDRATSGVIFTIDTESGFDKVVFINAAYGLGETVVQGSVNPDEFYVYKKGLKEERFAILRRNLGSKAIKMIYTKSTRPDQSLKTISVNAKDRQRFCITDDEAQSLGRYAVAIEEHYGRPMDIEWAKDGVSGKLYIVQARPETVKSRESHHVIERFTLTGEQGEVKATGRSVGQKIGQGKARVIINPKQMDTMQKGEVLVADMTDPDWEPVMKRASALVTNRGGRTCHAAIVARELGIPAVVGCGDATKAIKTGERVTVSCAGGETGLVFEGLVKFKIEKIKIDRMPKLPFKICINMANPDKAFSYQGLPNEGVGLTRMEFMISNMIQMHPKALLNPKKLPAKVRLEIQKRTAAYPSPKEFYIEKLREGISTIAAAFYPKPVIVRFSDFKSNEYANLIGGEQFEPHEENPMLGFRGASRYVDERFRDCFALECEAIKRVRDGMGLTNTQVMIPFTRTVNEVRHVLDVMNGFGLKRGKNDLKVIMMCEIPSNALLAEEFLKYVDGFSIGSNDLTQLTLGLDRDSELVSSIFDERNAAVKSMLHMAITACNRMGKYVGICGQGPSDYPDLAKWLVDEGIQAVSLSPDSIVETWLYLAKAQTRSQGNVKKKAYSPG